MTVEKDMREFERHVIDNVLGTVLVLVLNAAADEMDLSTEDVIRLRNRIELECQSIDIGNITWNDEKQILVDEHGIEIGFGGKENETDSN